MIEAQKIRLLAVAIIGVALSANARFDAYQGAWATEDKPETPIVVVDPLFVWMNTNGCWRPCRTTGSESDPPAPLFTDYADNSPVHLCLKKPEQWWKSELEGKGAAVSTDDVFLAKRTESSGEIRHWDERRMARCPMPDWKTVAPLDLYIGEWQHGEDMRVRINADKTATYLRRGSDGGFAPVEGSERCWRKHGAGLLALGQRKAKAYDKGDFRSVPKTLLWIDPANRDVAVSIDATGRTAIATRVK